jgi:outer membrane lipoprotein SlyB
MNKPFSWKKSSQSVTLVLGLCVSSLLVVGCNSAPSGSVYKASDALKPQQVRFAELLSVRAVTIDTSSDAKLGTLAGGAIGGIAGSRLGSGSGTEALLGGVIGATVGAIAGSAAENMASKSEGWDLTVKMIDTGEVVSIVQAADMSFEVGQRVKVLVQNGKYRVSP